MTSCSRAPALRLCALASLLCLLGSAAGCLTLSGDETPGVVVEPGGDPTPADVPLDPRLDAELTCDAYCRDEPLGVSAVRLAFSGPATRFAAGDLHLDWTVYKEGFEHGEYRDLGSLSPTDGAAAGASLAAAADPAEAPEVNRVEWSEAGLVVVDVVGLEPGLLHRWRLRVRDGGRWLAGPSARCMAAVCPVDRVESFDGESAEAPR